VHRLSSDDVPASILRHNFVEAVLDRMPLCDAGLAFSLDLDPKVNRSFFAVDRLHKKEINVKLANLNPVTGLRAMLAKMQAAQVNNTSLAPVPTQVPVQEGDSSATVQEGEPVQGTFIDATGGPAYAPLQTNQYRRVIDSFDEDKETWAERGVRWFYMALAYSLPAIVAYFIGRAIGDGFSGGGFDWNDGWNAFNHVVSWAIEFSISGLVLAGAITVKRIKAADSSYIVSFVCIFVALIFFSIASGAAQWVLVESHFKLDSTPAQVAAGFRVLAAPIVDISSLLFLSIMRFKSLKKFIQDQQMRAGAIREVNQSEIAIQAAQVKAGMDTQAAMQDLAMKAEQNKVWTELQRMQGQAMIESAKRNMLPSPDEGNGYRRSRY
jgi:hypothetical protein